MARRSVTRVKAPADAVSTRARAREVDMMAVLQDFAGGTSLSDIARNLGMEPHELRREVNKPAHVDAYRAAREVHADAIYEEIAELETMLRGAWDEKDHVKVSAIRAEIDTKKWRAARMNRARYADAPEVLPGGGAIALVRVEIVRE